MYRIQIFTARAICLKTLGLLAGLAGTLALAACEAGPSVVSLKEAKQITAKFSGSFTPPPRTINDITAVLDEQQRADPEAAERARAAAYRDPPPDADGQDLAKFYWKRGLAAGKFGDVEQQIADLKEAERHSKSGSPRIHMDILWDLGLAETFAGNYADSIRHREESITNVPNNRRGALITRGSVLAVVYAAGGDLDAAELQLEKSEQLLVEARTWQSWGQRGNTYKRSVRRAEARILYDKGLYAEADPVFRAALRASEQEIRTGQGKYAALANQLLHISLAKNLVRQGRLTEAEIEVRTALTSSLSRVGRYSPETANVLKWLAYVLSEQGRHAEAEQLARASIDSYERVGATGDSLKFAEARRHLAESLVSQDQWQAALAEYDAIESALANDSYSFERVMGGELNWALALMASGRTAEARRVAEGILQRNQQMVGEKHYNTAAARGVLAMALAKQDERQRALAEFQEAIPILLSRSRQSDDENTTRAAREQRLGLILEAYIGLLADIRGTALAREAEIDAAVEGFRLADVASSRSVQRALGASSARAAARDPDLADLVRREQDAQKQVAALYGLLANVMSRPTDQRNPGAVQDLRVRIDQLRGARAALMEEIEQRFSDYAELINPRPATIEDARLSLGPGEALIATYVGENRSFVWAIPQQGEVAFAAAPLGRERVATVVADLRQALAPNAQTLGGIPDFDVALAHRLFESLLAPVKGGWGEAESLLVVAHGPLGQLPFSVLVTAPADLSAEREPLFARYRDISWLARDHAVTVLPSVTSLKTLRALPPGDPSRRAFAGFGDPWFSDAQAAAAPAQTAELAGRGALAVRGLPVRLRSLPEMDEFDSAELAQLPRLPDTADELRGIALAMNADLTTDVFTGKEANESVVKSLDLSGRRVVAFATHGLVPGDLNGLTQPALALSAPQVAGVEGDGLLTMGEILGLKMDADWVVLSACNTAAAQGAGAEAVSGLGRAFFYAGARALLVSNWPVETTSAKALTTDIFRRQAEDPSLSRAEALRQAMLGLVDGPGYVDGAGQSVFSYAHPIFWAPFSLVGDGGGVWSAVM
jgi:CHAT domain-containing protein